MDNAESSELFVNSPSAGKVMGWDAVTGERRQEMSVPHANSQMVVSFRYLIDRPTTEAGFTDPIQVTHDPSLQQLSGLFRLTV